MAMPAARASRAERKRVSRPSSRKRPENSGCTPAMIFISVLLPAPFPPTSPWISPGRSAKSTPRSASTPPKVLPIPCSSRRGEAPCGMAGSDQAVVLHPLHARCIRLGNDGAVGDDAFRNALAAFLAGNDGGNTCDNRPAVDAAGGIAAGFEHPTFSERL